MRSKIDPSPVHVTFMVENVVLRYVFLRVLYLCFVTIFPSVVHTILVIYHPRYILAIDSVLK